MTDTISTVGIIGLGYDLVEAKVEALNAGDSYIVDVPSEMVDLRNAVRQRLSGSSTGAIPSNVDVL